ENKNQKADCPSRRFVFKSKEKQEIPIFEKNHFINSVTVPVNNIEKRIRDNSKNDKEIESIKGYPESERLWEPEESVFAEKKIKEFEKTKVD
ncbi:hypothetical protein BB560_003644, partial [Smittium megazygosporum]